MYRVIFNVECLNKVSQNVFPGRHNLIQSKFKRSLLQSMKKREGRRIVPSGRK